MTAGYERELRAQASLNAAISAAFNRNFVHCFTLPSKKLAAARASEEVSEPQYISTDAVAHLISLKSVSCDLKEPILVDVRRHDERALFGCIQGSVHVPVEQLANALQEPPAAFEEVAGTPAWAKDDLLIFHSRENLRACWAALLASERGVSELFTFTHLWCFP
jgi:rhodanese-related sulfurtransferase